MEEQQKDNNLVNNLVFDEQLEAAVPITEEQIKAQNDAIIEIEKQMKAGTLPISKIPERKPNREQRRKLAKIQRRLTKKINKRNRYKQLAAEEAQVEVQVEAQVGTSEPVQEVKTEEVVS